jgi:F5/8 type C domain
MTDDRNDQFDDLFEPFELTDPPPASEEPPPRRSATSVTPTQSTSSNVMCPSCGAVNPDYNRHCEQCGARLSQEPLPVAPPPMSRTSPGGRALGVLAAVVLIVALVALIFNVFRGGGESADSTSTTSSSTTTLPPVVTEVFPTQADASSELNASYSAANLIDGDPDTAWNDDSARGKDAVLTFRFARPVQLAEIEFQNLSDEERFKLNYKIQGFSITVDDLSIEINDRLDNTNEPQRVSIASVETTELVIRVLSTYAAEPVGDRPPFDELALQEVRFFGTEK